MLRCSVIGALIVLMFSFTKIAFAADLADSVVGKGRLAGKEIYDQLKERAKNDDKKSFVEHMVSWEKVHEALWEPLVSGAYQDGTIKPADLDYVVKQYTHPTNPLTADLSRVLFKIVITDRLEVPGDKAMKTILSLENPCLEVSYGYIPSAKRTEQRSVLVSCIENGYVDAFKTILKSWPQNDASASTVITVNEIIQEADTEKSGYVLAAYKDKKVSHKLIPWIYKKIEESQSSYTSWGALDYTAPANQILLYNQERQVNNDGTVINLAVFLKKQKILSGDINFGKLVENMVSIDGLEWKKIPDDIQAEILKHANDSMKKAIKTNNPK